VKKLIIEKEITLREMKKFIQSRKKWIKNSATYHDFKEDMATYQFFDSTIYSKYRLEVTFKRYIIRYTIFIEDLRIVLFIYRRLDKPLTIEYWKNKEKKFFSKQPKEHIELHERFYKKRVKKIEKN